MWFPEGPDVRRVDIQWTDIHRNPNGYELSSLQATKWKCTEMQPRFFSMGFVSIMMKKTNLFWMVVSQLFSWLKQVWRVKSIFWMVKNVTLVTEKSTTFWVFPKAELRGCLLACVKRAEDGWHQNLLDVVLLWLRKETSNQSGRWFGWHQFYFSIYWVAFIIPTDSYFSEGLKPPTGNKFVDISIGIGTMQDAFRWD